jgi:Domain of unknown function (DUF4328)
MSQTIVSKDGEFYWDGSGWRSTLSPDGAWRWSGTEWLPSQKSKGTAQIPGRYASSRALALLVSVLLGANAVVVLVSAFLVQLYFNLTITFGNQEVIYSIDPGALVVFAISAVLFLVWLRRTHMNLTPLGAKERQFSLGWAVGWWFVPVAWWWMPYRVVAEIWRSSSGLAPATASSASNGAATHPAVVVFWWVMWVISTVLVNLASFLIYPDVIQSALVILSAISTVLAASFGIVVVQSISSTQDWRWRDLQVTRDLNAVTPILGGES